MKILKNYIDEIIIAKDKETEKLGLPFDEDGECAIMMCFQDGKAVEVDKDGKPLPAQRDPLTMTYPTMKEVRASREMQNEIMLYTGRERTEISQYEIALKYGTPRRHSGREYLRIADLCFVYARLRGMKSWRAFDVDNKGFAGNIIDCSMVENNEKTQTFLQHTAELNRPLGLQFQLRMKGKVLFETAA